MDIFQRYLVIYLTDEDESSQGLAGEDSPRKEGISGRKVSSQRMRLEIYREAIEPGVEARESWI